MFKFAGIAILAIAVEAYFGLNSLINWLVWTTGWLPTSGQLIVAAIAVAAAIFAVLVFGWVAVTALAVIAVWPIFGLSLGIVDHLFFGWAHRIAHDPSDPAQVVGNYHLMHYGTLVVVAGLLIAGTMWAVRRL